MLDDRKGDTTGKEQRSTSMAGTVPGDVLSDAGTVKRMGEQAVGLSIGM